MILMKLCLVLLLCYTAKSRSEKLSEYITYYEPLTYNHEIVHQSHLRAKRSTYNSIININFHAHGRHFNLRLKRDTSAFAKDLSIETSTGVNNIDMSHLYSGHLLDDPESSIYGSIRNGIFEGKIHTPDKIFYVERAHKYFIKNPQPFHSVIYSSEDVKDPHAEKRENHLGGCGITEEVLQWMQEISNSADTREFSHKEKTSKTILRDRKERSTIAKDLPHYIYTREAQNLSPLQKEPLIEKRTCTLYIQTDTFLWKHIRSYEPSESSAREEISSLISQHVKAVNYIYENTDFDGYRGIKFVVQRIKINDTTSCPNIGSEYKRSNPFCSPNIDVSNFLNLNSQFNHDDFCLAYIFTYRDFSGGTLGLAWVASASGASGGICEKYKPYNENVNGRQVQTKRSLNTGVITFVNYNIRVAPKVSELTLAHEIGHNFGSPHDYPVECRPGGSDGNFIMYASATSGDRLNNNKFSPCSIRNISTVLRAVFNGEGKENCFQKGDGAFCGNKIVEAPEECDCGYDGKECNDKCCYPRDVKPYKKDNPNAERCNLRPTARCSPSQGPCCLPSCDYVKSREMCRAESECTISSFCDGKSAICPLSKPKPNKTECNKGTQVCWNGECTGSICQKYNMEECFLTSANGAKPEEMCEVACQNIGQPDSCRSTYKISAMKNISGLKLQPGSPCNDYQGYCDVFQKCRAVDAEGPLARLKNLLLNQQTLKTIKEWITTYWWAVMLMLVGLAIFMGFFIKCCAVHTPSSNPRKAPALRITDTLRHPADTLRRKRHRPPPQPGIPSGPPPPYPGPQPTAPPASSIPVAGPSRGYGEGRGHYNRRDRIQGHGDRTNPYVDDPSYAPAYPGRGSAMEMRVKSHA